MRWLSFCICLGVAACSEQHDQARDVGADNNTAVVVASNYPLYFFATRISDGVDETPEIILPEFGGDPAEWIPSIAQIQLLQSADLVLLNGAGAEPWLDWITLRNRRLIDTSSELSERLIPLDDTVAHQHGPEGEHSHRGRAFTIWLDPQFAIAQAHVVTEALVLLTPSHTRRYRDNMAVLEQDLAELDRRLADVFENLHGQPVLFSHPVYQYLQHRYAINGASVHWEPDAQPALSGWTELRQRLVSHPAKVMVWEEMPLRDTAARLADLGIASVPYHSLANRPAQGNFMTGMLDNARRLEAMTKP